MASTTSPRSKAVPQYNVFATNDNTTIGARLERISSHVLLRLVRHEFDDPVYQHFAPIVYADYDGSPGFVTREQYLEDLERIMNEMPDPCYEPVSSCWIVRGSSKRKATVWITARVTGVPLQGESIRRELVIKFEWRRGKEGWQIVSKTKLRGSVPFS